MPNLSNELIAAAHQALDNAVLLASQTLDMALVTPSLTFNQRGKIAGSARIQLNEIRLNPVLFSENPDYFLAQVIPHELCHLLVAKIWGRVKPHGIEWQGLMHSVFNLTPDTTHTLNVTNVAGKTFPYSCRCGLVDLSIRRHNKVLRNQQTYLCRRCGEPFKPVTS